MSLQVEKLENNMVKLTIEASSEEFEKAMEKAYHKNKNRIDIQGFRKGKAPRAIIEKMYGAEMFYEDAANEVIPGAYEKAVDESDLDIVSRPSIDVVQVEKGKPFIFTAKVAVKPEITLGKYKEIEVETKEISVTDEEVMEQINKEMEQNSRMLSVEDRPVQDKDITIIDFEGSVDGQVFEGGTGKDYSLTIGSHSFIDNFEEQLIGKNIGEELEVNVTFPDDYQDKELAGKPALFKVTIKEIKAKELPELDDDFAQDVSEYDTLEEYKESIKTTINENKEKEAKTAKENEIIEKIIEDSKMDIPEPMIEAQVSQMVDNFANRLSGQGLSIEQYFQFTGMDSKKFMDSMRPQALKRIQSRLVLEAIAKEENIEVTEEDINKEIKEMATMYKMEEEKIVDMIGDNEKEQMKDDIAVQKAVDFVVEQSKEK